MASTDYNYLPELLQEYSDNKLSGLSDATKKEYLHKLLLFNKYLLANDKTLLDITRKTVNSFRKQYEVKENKDGVIKKKSRATVKLMIAAIKSYAEYLYEEDELSDKEYKKIKMIKVKLPAGKECGIALTEEQIAHCFRKIINPSFRMIFWTGINYGIRLQVYRNLKISDIDLAKRIITINSKGDKTRKIKILKSHVKIWKQWLVDREAQGIEGNNVFYSSRGKLLDRTLQRQFKKMNEITGLSFTSHDLRRTFATRLYRNGVDLLVISRILGHSKIETTIGYLKILEEEILSKYEQQLEQAGF
jgi:integrase/recombinase XerD